MLYSAVTSLLILIRWHYDDLRIANNFTHLAAAIDVAQDGDWAIIGMVFVAKNHYRVAGDITLSAAAIHIAFVFRMHRLSIFINDRDNRKVLAYSSDCGLKDLDDRRVTWVLGAAVVDIDRRVVGNVAAAVDVADKEAAVIIVFLYRKGNSARHITVVVAGTVELTDGATRNHKSDVAFDCICIRVVLDVGSIVGKCRMVFTSFRPSIDVFENTASNGKVDAAIDLGQITAAVKVDELHVGTTGDVFGDITDNFRMVGAHEVVDDYTIITAFEGSRVDAS